MANPTRVQELLERALSSGMTPEQVCGDDAEMLAAVRVRWEQCRRLDARLADFFPRNSSTDPAVDPDGSSPPVGGENEANDDADGLPTIPGFQVEGVLGRGGMGIVYRAQDLTLRRRVALKMLLSGAYAGRVERARFLREARAVAGLQHPNVVQVYEIGEHESRPYFAMELVEGGSLAKATAGVPQPAEKAATLVHTIAQAIDAAHRTGIVHRDLKPANVLLTTDVTPKVGDFGLAFQAGDGEEPSLTLSGTRIGTPSYMAPEQAIGKRGAIGPAADIYALGAILYELITGRPPFRAETPEETIRQVINQEPVAPARLNAKVPRDLDTICLKCLHKDPGKRYQAAADFAADLQRFLRHEPIIARPTGRIDHLLRWARRRPAAAGLLAAVLLLVMALGLGASMLYRQRLTAHARQAQSDHEVRSVIQQAQVTLTDGWLEHDLTKLTQARTEADQAVGIARNGTASAVVQHDAQRFREDAVGRLERAKKNRALMEALLDVSVPRKADAFFHDEPSSLMAQTADEQYAAAFRRWGLDVDGSAEAQTVERLRVEPDVVLQEIIAGLDRWMIERRGQNRPEAECQRLFRIADQLDRDERHRRLRALLVRVSPPSAEELATVRQGIDPAKDPAVTIVLLARAYTSAGNAVAAEDVLRQAATAQPGEVVLLDTFANVLEKQGSARLEEAIGYFRAARASRPNLGVSLSTALRRAGRPNQAEEVLRELIRKQPDNYACRLELGYVLAVQGKFAEAEAATREAAALEPDSPTAYKNLGNILYMQHKYAEAEAAYRKSIALKPDYSEPYNSLGNMLFDQHKYAEAETAYRKSIALKPDYSEAYNNLSLDLGNQNRHAEAEVAAREAVRLTPRVAEVYVSLGLALHGQGKHAESEAAFRKSIAIRPDYSYGYTNLARELNDQHMYADAEAASRTAIALQADSAQAYTYLASSLAGQEKNVEAEAAIHHAVALNPNSVEVQTVLGWTLMLDGRFKEAADALTKADTLLPAGDFNHSTVRGLLQQCRRYLTLDSRLPAILHGTDKAASAAEQLEFADLCIRKRLFAAAAHFCAEAFNADPKLAEDVPGAVRYNAACVAAEAGCGQGEDAAKLDDTERARLRRQALDWYRQDLIWWTRRVETGTAPAGTLTALRHWQDDPDLACVRANGLSRLPAEERPQWERLWSELDALLQRASGPK